MRLKLSLIHLNDRKNPASQLSQQEAPASPLLTLDFQFHHYGRVVTGLLQFSRGLVNRAGDCLFI